MSLQHTIVTREENYVIYMVKESRDESAFEVRYNYVDKQVSCICKMFESMGLLYCHCLKVLKHESVVLLESKYIVNRWRKDFKRANMEIAGFQNNGFAEDTRF